MILNCYGESGSKIHRAHTHTDKQKLNKEIPKFKWFGRKYRLIAPWPRLPTTSTEARCLLAASHSTYLASPSSTSNSPSKTCNSTPLLLLSVLYRFLNRSTGFLLSRFTIYNWIAFENHRKFVSI